MFGGQLRVLEIFGDSADLGRGHGSACADMIRKYLDARLELSRRARWSGKEVGSDFVLECAERTLPHHERYSESLYAEMVAMAGEVGISPAEAVVVGGFTDLVDVVRGRFESLPEEPNCTAVLNPDLKVLAQTWDMHASAGEYVVMLKVDPLMGPDAFVQTTAGCLGQIGMNEAGIAVGINNLTAIGKLGVTWPFVVRKALEQTELDSAIEVILEADLAGGHNFLVMGPDGQGANIEAMPHMAKVSRTEGVPIVHTNHCLDTGTAAGEGHRLPEHVTDSSIRFEIAVEKADDIDALFSDPAIIRKATDPEEIATCGAVIMEPEERRMRAVWGIPGEHEWETFQL